MSTGAGSSLDEVHYDEGGADLINVLLKCVMMSLWSPLDATDAMWAEQAAVVAVGIWCACRTLALAGNCMSGEVGVGDGRVVGFLRPCSSDDEGE